MKINSQNPLTRPTPPREEAQPVKAPSQPNQQDAGPAATTHLRQNATDSSRDIDTARSMRFAKPFGKDAWKFVPTASPTG
ncbi:hypothetical protein Q427_16785 [Halomonas sp. BC04]|nr:hypothetical protein Q427_16785 [Halomonas sp. BC04]